ncbi:MAG TPA: hypothetical protein VFX78_08075 [Candidatus Eisenbacteria bacterium]|nr:hypothetical protein [Candidatus Eisenbacteria bacterium]
MSKLKEVVREAHGDAAKGNGSNASCCGSSCCSAESTPDRPKEVSSEKYGDDAARLAENGAKDSCCKPSCCG